MAGRAEAADARLRFSIPTRSYADALIDLGLQANISILGTASCGPDGRAALSGRYTVREALTHLLDGAPCRYAIIDDRTVRILAGAPSAPPQVRDAPRAPALVSEVVVTATKRPVSLDQLPAGVSAISRDQIAATRAVDVGQTMGQLAGVLTTNLGPGRDKLLVRGLSDGAFTGRTRSTVSTYLDDAPINYNAPDPDLRLVDIDRVEVVRGPQGALYGSGSLAGIYRIVTSKPDLEHPLFGAAAGVATTKGGDSSHEFDGYANIPLVKDHVGLRIAAYRDIQGGYLDDVNLRIANVDQTRRDGGRISLRVRLDEHWRFDAQAATQHLRSNDTQYVVTQLPTLKGPGAGPVGINTDGGTPVSAPGQRRNGVREAHNNDFSYGGFTLQGDFDWGSVTSSGSYVHHVFSSQFDATASLDASDPMAPLGGVANETDLGVFTEATRSNMIVQDTVVRSSGVGPFDWLFGVYAASTVERTPSSIGILSTGPKVMTAYREARKDRQREYAVYGEGSYAFGGGWSATLGGRFFETRVHTTAQLEVIQPYGPRFFDQARSYTGFSPKISLQRQFSNGDLIYGLMTEGYRPGGFNSSGFYRIDESRVTFAPDRLQNFELGAKLRRLDGRLGIRTTAYYDDWSRIQTDRYRPSGLAYTANVADAEIYGLETEVSYEWPSGLSLQLNGLLSDSKIKNPNPAFRQPVTKDLPGVPKISGGAVAVYERALPRDLTLRLVAETSYVGRANLTFDDSQTRRMGHYLRANLSAEVASDHWRLMAYVTNPFDDAGDTFAYGNPFTFARDGVRQATPQRPRTVGVRLGAAF